MNNRGRIPQASLRPSAEPPTTPEHSFRVPVGSVLLRRSHPILISLGRCDLLIWSGLLFALGQFEGTGLY